MNNEWEPFWKQRYDVLNEEMKLVIRENAEMFKAMLKVKAHTDVGEILKAVGTVTNLVDKLDKNKARQPRRYGEEYYGRPTKR